MKKVLFVILISIMVFPYNIFAKEKITLNCEKDSLYNNQQILCEINVGDLEYIATSISGKIKLSDNLIITESFYDDSNWMILDNKFSVEDINLISENKEMKENFQIARFRVKAINKKNTIGKIEFENVIIGDENYDEREEIVEYFTLKLEYIEKDNFLIKLVIPSIFISLVIIVVLYCYLKRKKKESK